MNGDEKIIIVESDISMAAKLSLKLNKLGYNITGIFAQAKDALHFLKQEVPDLILLDDRLKGQLNGVEMHKSADENATSPIVYFNNRTALSIEKIIPASLKNKLKNSFNKLPDKKKNEVFDKNAHYILKDRIFIRHRDRMIKISLDDIQYIEADRNYCKVYLKNSKYLLVTTLKEVAEKLSEKRFIRIHRSYIANISHIDEIGNNHVVIASHSIPLSKNMRTELFRHLQVI